MLSAAAFCKTHRTIPQRMYLSDTNGLDMNGSQNVFGMIGEGFREFFGFGEYKRPAEGWFSWQHIVFVTSLMLVMIVLAIWLGKRNRHRDERTKNKVLIAAALLIDGFEIFKIKAYALANKDSEALNIHMCFLGNPGSGKTEAARCIAGILHENGILPTDKIVEVDRSGLVSQYFGATAEKTSRVIARAMGGVLFIDEAYALGNNADH